MCAYVDQKQLLYAIQAEYLSGPLRRGFYDILIALHLESFATTMYVRINDWKLTTHVGIFYYLGSFVFCREVCKNEFIIPIIPELKEFYEDDAMRHSIRSVTTISIRPAMSMTDIELV